MCSTNTTNTNDLSLTEKNGGSCACCAAPVAASTEATAPVTSEYLVTGLTCGHCVSSVTEELSTLDGVASVTVDLDAGGLSRVRVDSSAALDLDAVRAAVDEAGYALVTSAP